MMYSRLLYAVISLSVSCFLAITEAQAINFTLHGNHLLNPIVSEIDKELKFPLEDIYSHGCWCSILRINEKPLKPKRGHPLDAVDNICRSYSQCIRCVGIEGYCETSKKHYFVINKKKTPWTCNFPQTDFCSRERCDCDLNAAMAIRKYIKKNPKWRPVGPEDQSAGSCRSSTPESPITEPKHPGAANKRNRCCKVGGLWEAYNNQTHSCDFENNKLVPGSHDFGARTVSAAHVNKDLDLMSLYHSQSEVANHLIDEPNPFETQGARPPSAEPTADEIGGVDGWGTGGSHHFESDSVVDQQQLLAALFMQDDGLGGDLLEDQIQGPSK